MRFIYFILVFSFISCTPMKRMQTGISRGLIGSEKISIDGHEVYCSEGPVCSEVEVLAISVENRDGGRVRVTFKNRTDNQALVQVRLQIISADGEVLAETRAENFPIPPTQEKVYEMPGVYKKDAKVRVMINTAY